MGRGAHRAWAGKPPLGGSRQGDSWPPAADSSSSALRARSFPRPTLCAGQPSFPPPPSKRGRPSASTSTAPCEEPTARAATLGGGVGRHRGGDACHVSLSNARTRSPTHLTTVTITTITISPSPSPSPNQHNAQLRGRVDRRDRGVPRRRRRGRGDDGAVRAPSGMRGCRRFCCRGWFWVWFCCRYCCRCCRCCRCCLAWGRAFRWRALPSSPRRARQLILRLMCAHTTPTITTICTARWAARSSLRTPWRRASASCTRAAPSCRPSLTRTPRASRRVRGPPLPPSPLSLPLYSAAASRCPLARPFRARCLPTWAPRKQPDADT